MTEPSQQTSPMPDLPPEYVTPPENDKNLLTRAREQLKKYYLVVIIFDCLLFLGLGFFIAQSFSWFKTPSQTLVTEERAIQRVLDPRRLVVPKLDQVASRSGFFQRTPPTPTPTPTPTPVPKIPLAVNWVPLDQQYPVTVAELGLEQFADRYDRITAEHFSAYVAGVVQTEPFKDKLLVLVDFQPYGHVQFRLIKDAVEGKHLVLANLSNSSWEHYTEEKLIGTEEYIIPDLISAESLTLPQGVFGASTELTLWFENFTPSIRDMELRAVTEACPGVINFPGIGTCERRHSNNIVFSQQAVVEDQLLQYAPYDGIIRAILKDGSSQYYSWIPVSSAEVVIDPHDLNQEKKPRFWFGDYIDVKLAFDNGRVAEEGYTDIFPAICPPQKHMSYPANISYYLEEVGWLTDAQGDQIDRFFVLRPDRISQTSLGDFYEQYDLSDTDDRSIEQRYLEDLDVIFVKDTFDSFRGLLNVDRFPGLETECPYANNAVSYSSSR